ncbi:hypothetical protein CVT24_000887 [Panaeolus cyanescens]|uniref:BTB domain-containing protein n=1 Tax=Panaeolus cyanescens TaxID=181874 RepID=A0A409YTI5_9AGAR|nr:hypothetical protein CVT24_000887 [Panaeolus cyanescens]
MKRPVTFNFSVAIFPPLSQQSNGPSPPLTPDMLYSAGSLDPRLSLSPTTSVGSSNPTNGSNPFTEEEVTTISVSTAFHPNSHPNASPDTIFTTSDSVWFYTSSTVILSRTPRAFRTLLGVSLRDSRFRDVVIPIDIPSTEFNVIMHLLYGSSPAPHSPTFDTLLKAVDRLPLLDMNPQDYVLPNTPLYSLLLSYAPLHPLDVYSLAGHHDLYTLASQCSPHLLALSLSTITDQQAERMGAVYLKKLLLLHVGRIGHLRDILLKVPDFHPETKKCTFNDQKAVSRAWALGSASLVWDARPDLSSHSIQTSLSQLMEPLLCDQCQMALKNRIKDVVARWTSVKVIVVFMKFWLDMRLPFAFDELGG